MAVGIGTGFDLDGLDAAIKKAEAGLNSFGKAGKSAAKQLNDAFELAKNGNIQDFISVIERLSQSLGKKGYNSAAQMIREIKNESVDAIDKTNRMVSLMQTITDGGRSAVKNGAIESLKTQLDDALSRLGVLNERLQFYTKGEGAKAVNANVVDTSALQAEANQLRVVVELLQRKLEHEQALAALKQRSGAIQRQQQRDSDWTQMERERTAEIERQNEIAKKANKAYEQAWDERYRAYSRLMQQLWEEDLKYFEKQNAQAKSGSQQYAQDYENRQRYYEKWINESFQQEENKNKKLREEEEAEKKRISQEIFREKIDQLGRESRERQKIEQMIRDTQKKNHEAREKELNDLFREQERQQKLQAQYDSKSRRERYKTYTTSYEGAVRTSDKAKTLAQELQAVRNLEAARSKLNKTDADYERKLRELNERIRTHNQNIRRATEESKALENQHLKLKDMAGGVGRALAAMFSVQAIRGYINKMIEIRGEFELQQRSLQAIVQDKDKANEVWQKTVDLAVRSPFRIKELVTYTKQLAAYRIETEKLYETNKMLADISAGLGVDMNRLILAFGQVKAANYLRGTELRQFTEAGIPMLEELAKLYSEMENKLVSAADVFDRISKRGVLFEDVEEVLKRMTEAGGVFYQMQEKQAETLKGQISNLKDSIDLMLNDMGRANDGALKFSVKSVKLLVDNYEKLVPVLKTIIALLAIYKINAKLAAREAAGLALSWSSVGTSLKSMLGTLTKNPWMLWLTAIVAVANDVGKVVKQFREINKQYDELLNAQSEVSVKYFKTQNIDERKKALKELIDFANKEYQLNLNINVEDIKEADLDKQFNVVRQKMLEANAFAAEFAKNWVKANLMSFWSDFGERGIFEQSLNKDLDQLGTSYDNLNQIMMRKLSRTIVDLSSKFGELNDVQKEALESLKTNIGGIVGKEDEDIIEYFDRIRGSFDILLESDAIADKKLSRQLKKYQRRMKEAQDEFEIFIKRIDQDVMSLNDDDKKVFLEAAINDEKSRRNWTTFKETQIRKWLEEKFEIELTPKVIEADKSLQAWQDSYNELFAGKTGFRKITQQAATQKQVIDRLNGSYQATKELIDSIERAGEDSVLEGGAYEGQDLEKLKLDLAEIREQLEWFGAKAKEDDKETASVKILQRRINLLKEVNKKYLELEKTYGSVIAKEKVMEAYSDTFREAFEGTGVSLDMYQVMTQVITDSKKVGEDIGSNLADGVVAKLKELEEAGTYIRNYSEELLGFTQSWEEFIPYAYYDQDERVGGKPPKAWESKTKKGTLTIGTGITNNSGIGFTFDERTTITEIKNQELLAEIYKEKVRTFNEFLDLNKDLILTQEQYNMLLDQYYQGEEPTKKAINLAKGEWEQFEKYLNIIKGYKQLNKKAVIVDVEAIKQEWDALDTLQEKLALTMKWTNIVTSQSKKVDGKKVKEYFISSGMQNRSLARSANFSGDLDIAKQLETVLVRIAGMDFATTEGMVKALEKLKEIAKKEGPEAQKILSQTISGFEAEIGLRVAKEEQKKILDQVQDIFNKYDLSLELKKLDIPPIIAKKLFNVDMLDFEGLREKVIAEFAGTSEDVKTELNKGILGADWEKVAEVLGKDQIQEVRKALEKINDLENKASVERMKTYSKYLVKEMSERVRLKVEELRKLKEIEESEEFTPRQKKLIKAQVSKEARVAQDSQAWKDFQGTEMYTMMFEDLEFLGTKALETLKNKLSELKSSLKDLPASEVKEVIGQISKIEDITIKRNPFASLRDAMAEVNALQKEGKTEDVLQETYMIATAKRESYMEDLEAIELILGAEARGIDLTQQSVEWQKKYADYLSMSRDLLQEEALVLRVNASSQGLIANDAAKNLASYAKARKSLSAVSEEWGTIKSLADNAYGSVKQVLAAMGEDSDSVAMTLADSAMNMVELVFQAVMFDMQLKAMTAQAELLNVAMNTALGPIGWIVLALQAVATLLNAVFSAQDKSLQEQVERHTRTVETLQKRYEDLDSKLDEAWDTASIKQYNQELKETTEAMIIAQKAAIAAQSQRKGASDSDSDVYKELQDMKEELEEMENQLKETLEESFSKLTDGILDSVYDAAKEFTDAWYEAFRETGDGLSGLQENFDEMFMNLAKNQAAMQITGKWVKDWQDSLKKYINVEKGDTEITPEDAAAWAEEIKASFPALSEALEAFLGVISPGLSEKGTGLTSLQKGIQGITEDQADVIESYLNSIRGYAADQLRVTQDIYNLLSGVHRNASGWLNVKLV